MSDQDLNNLASYIRGTTESLERLEFIEMQLQDLIDAASKFKEFNSLAHARFILRSLKAWPRQDIKE